LFEELLAGKRFILIVDEAQNLEDSVLETVRMLSNFETHNTKLLQIILAGQPGLAAKLAQPRLSQLRQRVAALCRLEHFDVEETGNYITHRLKVAGHSGEPIFSPASIGLMAKLSRGIPRNINNYCYQSLLLAHSRALRTVTVEIVQEAVARLEMAPLLSEPPIVADFVASPASPVTSAKAAGPRSVPIAAPIIKDRPMNPSLTYGAGKKINVSKWPLRSGILVVFFFVRDIATLHPGPFGVKART